MFYWTMHSTIHNLFPLQVQFQRKTAARTTSVSRLIEVEDGWCWTWNNMLKIVNFMVEILKTISHRFAS